MVQGEEEKVKVGCRGRRRSRQGAGGGGVGEGGVQGEEEGKVGCRAGGALWLVWGPR